jgi:hypothetical protein
VSMLGENIYIYPLCINYCGDDSFDRLLEFWFRTRDVPNNDLPIATTSSLQRVLKIRESIELEVETY